MGLKMIDYHGPEEAIDRKDYLETKLITAKQVLDETVQATTDSFNGLSDDIHNELGDIETYLDNHLNDIEFNEVYSE